MVNTQALPVTLETWSHLLFLAGSALVLVGWIGTAFVKDPQYERWLFWLSSFLGITFISLSLASRGWKTVVIFGVGMGSILLFYTYFQTPYIVIRGRVRSFRTPPATPDPSGQPSDEPPQPPPRDSYPGPVTARKAWWLFTVLVAFFGVGGAAAGWDSHMLPAAGLICILAFIGGIDDATRKLPMARGQKVQALIIAAVSVVMFFLPPALYIVGYSIGTKRPMGYGLRDPVARHYAELDAEDDKP